jgi:hypothetical protein
MTRSLHSRSEAPTAQLRTLVAADPVEIAAVENAATFEIRRALRDDLEAIAAIDALHSGAASREDWAEKLDTRRDRRRAGRSDAAGFVACSAGSVIGFVFVEARAWEFGSPLCGWITAIGVDPAHLR